LKKKTIRADIFIKAQKLSTWENIPGKFSDENPTHNIYLIFDLRHYFMIYAVLLCAVIDFSSVSSIYRRNYVNERS